MSDKNPGVKTWKNARNGFFVFRCHYTASVKKRDAAWIAAARQGISTNDWNREMEIDFSSFVGKPVFLHDYNPETMFVKCLPDTKSPMLRSWDFGYHHPAVAWGQFVDGITLQILLSDMGNDIDFRLYVRHVLHLSELHFPGRRFMDCCDRAGDFDRPTGDSEVRILSNEFGIVPRFRASKVTPTITQVRNLMHGTYRNKPCFLVNDCPENTFLNEALRGGYHYAEKTHGREEKEEPFQDHYYENIVDPVRYLVLNFLGDGTRDMEVMQKMSLIDVPPEKEIELW